MNPWHIQPAGGVGHTFSKLGGFWGYHKGLNEGGVGDLCEGLVGPEVHGNTEPVRLVWLA